MTIFKALKIAYKIKRFERRRKKDIYKKLDALTDPTLIQRIRQKTDTEIAFERLAKVLSKAGISVAEWENYVNSRYGQRRYKS